MTLTFRMFIEEKYDVRERIQVLKSDPLQQLIESDDFPFDFIDNDNGELRKMVYYKDGDTSISVLDLLSYRREDLVKNNDIPLLEIYDSYVENIEFDNLDWCDPVQLSKVREESLKRKGDMLA